MRKFLLLCSIILMSIGAFAQKVTLYFNDFEHPNDTSRLTQDTGWVSGGNPINVPPKWTVVDTFGYNSDSSFHIKGKLAGHIVYFQTTAFSTDTTPYVNFSFWHIAKLSIVNTAKLYYTIDGGQSWTRVPIDGYYAGESPNYGETGNNIDHFKQISYGPLWGPSPAETFLPVLPSWWRKETFDLSNVLSDLSTTPATGYSNVMLRFEADVRTPTNGMYAAGWFVDDILVEGAPCELNKPKISFDFKPAANVTGYPNCFEPNPEGAQIELPDSNYPVAARVADTLKSYETGVDTVIAVYRVNGGAWDTIGLAYRSGFEYRGLFRGLGVGDIVDWYMLAYDGGCPPNEARMPDVSYNGTGYYTFFIEKGLPFKCDEPECGAAPYVIRSFPWTENFDGPEWITRSALKPAGEIPEDDYWKRNHVTNQNQAGFDYGWAVNTGPTPTQYTGPNGDHTLGAGKYMYLESGGNPSPDGAGQLYLPCIDLTNETGCIGLEFYYHMFGSEIGRLLVDIDTGQGVAAPFPPTRDEFVAHAIIGEQQKSSTDGWKRGLVDLTPYLGKYIRVKFRARNPAGGNVAVALGRNDIAIDDVKIFYPPNDDAEVLSNPEPKNGYCSFEDQPVNVIIRNSGCTPFNSINLGYNVSGGTPFSVTANLDTTLYFGDTITYSFTGANAFPAVAPGTYNVKAWSNLSNDSKRSNDTVTGPDLEYYLPITSFPFIEDFENATLGTQNLGNTDWLFSDGLDPNYRWQVAEEMTAERSTGPFRGYYHKGKYIYTQSNGSTGGLSTYMRTKCLDFSTLSNPALYFYYHMYGANIDKLEVQVSLANEPIDVWTTISTISGAGQQNNELDDWKLHRVNLNSYAGSSVKLRFKATRKGNGAKTHIALDKIMIFDQAAADAGGFVIDGPKNRGITAGPSGPNDPEVSISNFGSTALSTCTVNFKITLLCNPSVNNTYQYYYNGGSIAPGTTKKVSLSSVGINYPIGEFEACVWVTAPNGSTDNNAFNDTICRNIIGGNTTYSIPWKQNFDTCDYDSDGFINAQGFWQWELGKPSVKTPNGPGLIRDDHGGGGNAWVTNIDGHFLVGTTEQLRLPTYNDFDTVKNAQLRFWQVFDFGPNNGTGSAYKVGATCRYLHQNQWQILGGNTVVNNLGVNWYGGNDKGTDPITGDDYPKNNNGAPLINLFSGPGWVGNTATNGLWRYTMYPLNEFSLDTNAALAIRFEFKSDAVSMQQSEARGGWGIDDIEILIPPQNSVSPVQVSTLSPLPLPGVEQTLMLTVKNTGEKTIDSCLVDISIDGIPLGPTYKLIFTTPIAKGQSYTDTVPYKWPAAQVTSGAHEVCVITSRPDNKPDQIPSDDTLCKNLPVMLELDFTANGQDEYCEDFESNTTFQWIHKNAKDLYIEDTIWDKGAPISQMGAAPSGNTVWKTNTYPYEEVPGTPAKDTIYPGLTQAALFTPIIEVDSGLVYNFSFSHWFDTERYHDGGNVEYSFDGGITWYPMGYVNRQDTAANWFNTEFVTALDQIRGGWTGQSNGWIYSDYRMAFLDHGKVIFRFRFGSDYDIGAKGWAIDDFCFVKDTTGVGPEQEIGEGEYVLPEEALIGDMVPNPANEYSQLSFVFPTPQNAEIRVYNLVGQVMETRSSKFSEGVHTIEFNTASWSAGVYFVNFEYEGKMVTRKLIVK